MSKFKLNTVSSAIVLGFIALILVTISKIIWFSITPFLAYLSALSSVFTADIVPTLSQFWMCMAVGFGLKFYLMAESYIVSEAFKAKPCISLRANLFAFVSGLIFSCLIIYTLFDNLQDNILPVISIVSVTCLALIVTILVTYKNKSEEYIKVRSRFINR